ncbi:MAG: dihydrodipicolinate synthase family protein [Phycisphaeraceae bacterium]|nr:dihydrodipicolinate synthase family protein [Phycisphaeraceae bacterium]
MSGSLVTEGLVVPMVSPLTSDFQIDARAVHQIVEHLLAVPVNGIFILGTTGEARRLQLREKRLLVETVAPLTHGRCALYVGISDNDASAAVQAANEYHRLGADFAVAHPPTNLSDAGPILEAYFLQLAELIPLPLVMYNMPRITGVSIPIDMVERLSRHPNIVALKDSKNDATHVAQLLERLQGRQDFRVLIGCARLSALGLKRGAAGLVPSTANLFPQPYMDMIRAALAGNWDQVDRIQLHTNQLSAQYQYGRQLDESLAALKQLMASKGLCGPTAFAAVSATEPMGEPA